MDGLVVRPETTADHEAIADVVSAAFGSPAEARLVAAIRASENFIPALSLVGEVGGEVVGHVMISRVGLESAGARGESRSVVSLSPLAVRPNVHGQGVGSALVLEAVKRAGDLGEPLVVLEGSPAYYSRFGFEYAVPYGITIDLPAWAPAEAAQLIRLPAYDPAIIGRIVYPPAFDDVTHQD